MIGRILIAGIVGGIVMFIWGAATHMALPLGQMGVKMMPDEEVVSDTMRDAIAERGVYFIPGFPEAADTDPAVLEAWEERVTTGPYAFIVYKPGGTELMSAKQLLAEFGANFGGALIGAWIASLIATGFARRLLALTGLDVQENQARRLLNDILAFRAALERSSGQLVPEQIGALRWMVEVFEPTMAAVPSELRAKLADAEIFHQVLEHRWFLSEAAGTDVGTAAAVADYLEGVLPAVSDERTVFPPPVTGEVPITPP